MAETTDGGSVVSLLHLADEVLEMIFRCSRLDHRDLAALAAVCSRFWALSCSREVWKNKALERWKVWSFDIVDTSVDWKATYKERLLWQKLVYPAVRELSVLNFPRHDVSYDTMSHIDEMLKEQSSVPFGLSDALNEILQSKDSLCDLTMKYYARHVKEYVTFFQLENELHALFELASDEIELEKGAILLSQWQQSPLHVSADSVYAQLDAMTSRVKDLLTQSQPHCAGKKQTSALEERHATHAAKILRQRGDGQSANTSQSIGSAVDCCHQFGADVVLNMLNKVMFEEWEFVGNRKDYYSPTNSYIDEVLKNRTGMPITMCIVYVAVARRLGVKAEPVNFPRHFLIQFCKAASGSEAEEPVYVDVYNGGRFMTAEHCIDMFPMGDKHFMSESLFAVCHPRQVYSRMVRNMLNFYQNDFMIDTSSTIQHLLHFLHITEPDNVQNTKLLCTINVHLRINGRQTIGMLETIPSKDEEVLALMEHAEGILQESCEPPEAVVKRRTNPKHLSVTYRVGLVMHHKRYNYICVIYGWDPCCRMSRAWQNQMGVHLLPNKDKQPFYNVLVEDLSMRYAAQESLEMALAEAVKPDLHPQIGKYFSSFDSHRYIPNVELAKRYPDDV